MPKPRFEILADIKGTGEVKHVIRAHDQDEAKERYQSAYPKRQLVFVMVRKVGT